MSIAQTVGAFSHCSCLHAASQIELMQQILETVFATLPEPVSLALVDAFTSLYDDESRSPAASLAKFNSAVGRPSLSLSLVSGSVHVSDVEIALSKREYELLVFLALYRGVASTALLSESIWPETDADRARTSLKVTLSRLRSRLGDPSLILATQNGYQLSISPRIDIGTFLGLPSQSREEGAPSHIHLQQARLRLSNWPWAKVYESRLLSLEVARAQEIGA